MPSRRSAIRAISAVVELGKDLHTMKANKPEDWDGVVEVVKTHFAAKARSRVTVKLTARYQTPQGAARKAEAEEAADDAAQGAEEAQLAAIEAAEAVETATLQKRLALQTPGKRQTPTNIQLTDMAVQNVVCELSRAWACEDKSCRNFQRSCYREKGTPGAEHFPLRYAAGGSMAVTVFTEPVSRSFLSYRLIVRVQRPSMAAVCSVEPPISSWVSMRLRTGVESFGGMMRGRFAGGGPV